MAGGTDTVQFWRETDCDGSYSNCCSWFEDIAIDSPFEVDQQVVGGWSVS